MKLKSLLLAASVLCLGLGESCKKESGSGDPQNDTLYVNDAASLAANLNIEGAVRKTGNIPAPAGTNYGIDLNVLTPNIILTPGNTFDFEIESASSAKILYVQLDGTSEYMMVTVDAAGNVVNKITSGSQKFRQCCSPPGMCGLLLNAKPMVMENLDVGATVQVFQPPLQANIPDLSFLNDIHYWSPPRRIRYKTFNTGTGDIYATLTWNKEADIDLWLIEPNGNKIYYGNSTSTSGGELDYDNTYAYGPENIFYNTTPPSGKYEVWVHYYSGSNGPVDWVVNLKNGSSVNTYRGTLVNSNDKTLVATFTR